MPLLSDFCAILLRRSPLLPWEYPAGRKKSKRWRNGRKRNYHKVHCGVRLSRMSGQRQGCVDFGVKAGANFGGTYAKQFSPMHIFLLR